MATVPQANQETLAQLRPAYGMRASPTAMKEIIKNVLSEALVGQTYQVSKIQFFVNSGGLFLGRPGSAADEKHRRYCQGQTER